MQLEHQTGRLAGGFLAVALAGASTAAAAFPVSGRATVVPAAGGAPQQQAYGPADSGSGAEARIDFTPPGSDAATTAWSKAQGTVLAAATLHGQGDTLLRSPAATASWAGRFANPLGHAAQFVVDVEINFRTSAQFVDPLLPDGYTIASRESAGTAQGTPLLRFASGADAAAGRFADLNGPSGSVLAPGVYSFALGLLDAGGAIDLAFEAQARLEAAGGRVLACAPLSVPPQGCGTLAQSFVASSTASLSVLQVRAVPEPAAWALWGLGLAVLGRGLPRRRGVRRQSASTVRSRPVALAAYKALSARSMVASMDSPAR